MGKRFVGENEVLIVNLAAAGVEELYGERMILRRQFFPQKVDIEECVATFCDQASQPGAVFELRRQRRRAGQERAGEFRTPEEFDRCAVGIDQRAAGREIPRDPVVVRRQVGRVGIARIVGNQDDIGRGERRLAIDELEYRARCPRVSEFVRVEGHGFYAALRQSRIVVEELPVGHLISVDAQD